MHELSICQALADMVSQEMTKPGMRNTRVLEVRVAAGVLRQIVPDFLQDAFAMVTAGTPLAGVLLKVRSVPLQARCRACRAESSSDRFLVACKDCGSSDIEITGGSELFVESLEVEDV
jgi:hydrogenase nickel incorporation protein HypA/HybF